MFLDWWRKVRRNMPTDHVSRPEAEKVNKIAQSSLPLWLIILMRTATTSCFLALICGPVLNKFENQLCLVRETRKQSIADRAFALFLTPKSLRPIMFSLCPQFSHYATICVLPDTGIFAFSLLLFVLQLFFIITRVYDKPKSSHKLSRAHFEVSVLLMDAIVSLFALGTLVPVIPNVLAHAGLSHPMYHGRAPPIYLILLVLGLLLAASAMAGLKVWLSSCSNDWRGQRRALVQAWPDCNGSYISRTSLSGCATSISGQLSPKSTGCRSSSPFSELSDLSRKATQTAVSETGSSPSRPVFRPSVLTWPPESRNTPWTPSFTTEPRLSSKIASDASGSDDDSLITSVSQLRASPSRSATRSASTGARKTRSGHRRHRRHRKRAGLLRFCLSFLFGRLDTWKDVLDELTCLLNALLIGVIIYGIFRVLLMVKDSF
ncbi:unnamed protein product [Echinostoma caproni]|uniref:Uncharacterized protein n=1 Tax=Echinostoma caproni TaxID=27848 RepID=A0A183APQ2_9TREM|nr:unnamed protein product [Echinostoma caproni]